MLPTTNQTQQSSRNYPVASYPKAGRFLTTGTRRNPRNAAFQLNQTTSRCFLDWFLNSPAGHPVATQFPPTTGSSIHRLVILSRAQRLPDATPAQRLIFPHYHQLQATVTIKFQILPVVGYSTVDSIFGGIRQL
ncbi:putative leucine-rich repeat receptor-like serine/threonine-protein kinase [Dorcoceras hygrometricum]|uniref:Putative leucine-rich repeat receptor-like serine/threonine-protein kinase n=1 Tax=Dorcoceras hygrometricum TaxID=472368 RepID=A0A2Z7CB48_9LAMI|nr:putative leucine-rich repeat receptor-like serine/threonine-protein kinase [Dorcoceras hygrometricum]